LDWITAYGPERLFSDDKFTVELGPSPVVRADCEYVGTNRETGMTKTELLKLLYQESATLRVITKSQGLREKALAKMHANALATKQ
jgi:hypothetical protein